MEYNFRKHFVEQSLRLIAKNEVYLMEWEREVYQRAKEIGDKILSDSEQQLRNDLHEITRRFRHDED